MSASDDTRMDRKSMQDYTLFNSHNTAKPRNDIIGTYVRTRKDGIKEICLAVRKPDKAFVSVVLVATRLHIIRATLSEYKHARE